MSNSKAEKIKVIIAITMIGAGINVSGCEDMSDDRMMDVGYDDGYAVGYNTACKIRTTMVHGYDNKVYRQYYSAGELDGANACKLKEPDRYYGR